MDLINLPAIVARRWYVFVIVVAVALGGLGLNLARAPITYDAQVLIQLSAPPVDDVQLLSNGSRSSSTLQDDLLLVRNDFDVVVQSAEVRDRTIRQLAIPSFDQDYIVTTTAYADSNYLTLTVRARTPASAQAIANAHAIVAIQYYGEQRAKPAATTAAFLGDQLQAARTSIAALQKAAAAANLSNTPELQQAQANYLLLLQRQSDALLTSQAAARVSFVQIAQPAVTSTTPSWLKTSGTVIGLTLIGSLGLALLLTLVLESLFRPKPVDRRPVEYSTNRWSEPSAKIK